MNELPIRLHPVYKDYVWGGSRLKREYGKEDAFEHTAESWELSCLPGGESRAEGSCYGGLTLTEIARGREKKFFGEKYSGEFPLLVKLIDAERDLSVQVHPSDETACREKGEYGKAEMWYVVEAAPGATLYMGFRRELTETEFRSSAENGTICEFLNEIPVSAGDAFFIRPGTVHAIRGGLLIAEVQQSSDTTFRIFDYHRPGSDGKPRQLHLDEAARVVNYSAYIPAPEQSAEFRELPGSRSKVIADCPYFRVERWEIRERAELHGDRESFRHLLCVEGGGELWCEGKCFPVRLGDSFFLPASLTSAVFCGQGTVLLSGM